MIKKFNINKFYFLEFGIFGFFKIIFFLLLFYEYVKNKNIGHFARARYKWSNSFFIKFFTCFFIVINYFSITINILEDLDENINYLILLNIFNCLLWIFCVYMIYYEYIRKMNQKWLGLRSFWILNFIFYFIEIILLSLKVHYNKEKIYSKLLFYQIIQFIPSIILFIFSIFNPNDKQILLNKNSINEVNNIIENNNNNSNIKNEGLFFELQISNINSNKFQMKNNLLLSIKNKDENLNKKNTLENRSVKFNLKLFGGEYYSINKTIFELISFNKKIIENSKNKIDNYDKINKGYLIQIDNINIIFEKNKENEMKFKELQNIYLNLIKNYNFFINDFIDFCNIKNDEIKNKIQNQYLNNNHNNSSVSLNLNNSFDYLSYENNIKPDIIKAIEFISHIITNDKKIINIKINKLNNSQIINQCFFDCEYFYNNKKFPVQIKFNDLIEYSKNNFKVKSSEKIILIQNFLNNFQNIKNIFENNLKEKINYFQELLNNVLNNIFYYDDLFFKIFKLNDLINLDSDKLNIEIINNFFEIENNFMMNCYFNNSIFEEKNKKLKINFEKKIENNIFNIIINFSEKNINNILNLNELLLECKEIIQINKNFHRFNNLKIILENIINLINNENDNKINEIINLLNKFSEKENFYIFYSFYFRKIFKLSQINNNSNDLNEEINDDNNNKKNDDYNDELNDSMIDQNESLFNDLIS